ncbi:MAG: hypothetical protein ABII39_02595 [Candidatus Micrarchaeota archaeon]
MNVTTKVNKPRFERTTDPKRMLTHALLNEAIQKHFGDVVHCLPAITSTSIEYKAGATKAKARNEAESVVSIDLPLQNGWYVPDGNPFAIPNGSKSTSDDSNALYLVRYQDRDFSGPLGRGDWVDDNRGRDVDACYGWSGDSGVALVGREATAPMVEVSREALAKVTDPKALVQRAEQLENMANDFGQRFNGMLTAETYQRFVTEPLETAKMLRELAGNIESVKA